MKAKTVRVEDSAESRAQPAEEPRAEAPGPSAASGGHTPGPWALRGYQIRADNGRGAHVATYQISKADGTLIAAAPELLDMLLTAVDTLDACERAASSHSTADDIRARLDKLGIACHGTGAAAELIMHPLGFPVGVKSQHEAPSEESWCPRCGKTTADADGCCVTCSATVCEAPQPGLGETIYRKREIDQNIATAHPGALLECQPLPEPKPQPPAERETEVESRWVAHNLPSSEVEFYARRFHDVYEQLAATYNYETRKESRVPWDDVPENNRKLMINTAAVVMTAQIQERAEWNAERDQLRRDLARADERLTQAQEIWRDNERKRAESRDAEWRKAVQVEREERDAAEARATLAESQIGDCRVHLERLARAEEARDVALAGFTRVERQIKDRIDFAKRMMASRDAISLTLAEVEEGLRATIADRDQIIIERAAARADYERAMGICEQREAELAEKDARIAELERALLDMCSLERARLGLAQAVVEAARTELAYTFPSALVTLRRALAAYDAGTPRAE